MIIIVYSVVNGHRTGVKCTSECPPMGLGPSNNTIIGHSGAYIIAIVRHGGSVQLDK